MAAGNMNNGQQPPTDKQTTEKATNTQADEAPAEVADTSNAPTLPEGFDPANMPQAPENFDPTQMKQDGFKGMGGNMEAKGADLKYIDDETTSYANIFDNAKTNVDDTDKERLIASLKQLATGENLEDVVDIEATLRYFVVHNFVDNYDSYTGTMLHN